MKLDSSIVDAIDKNNQSLMGRIKSPGMVFGVVRAGKVDFIKGYGHPRLASRQPSDQDDPVTPDTVFRIASISKIFTAIITMKLMEQGMLSIDDPVEKHLKSYRIRKANESDPPITIRHLLTHTAGIGEFAPLLGYLPPFTTFGVSRVGRPLPPLARLYRGELRPDRSPGQAWSYANHGYATLGQVIADVTRDSFPNVARRLIFDPLGMDNSDFVRSERVTDDLAKGYTQIKDGYWPVLDLNIVTLADGSLFTTANDFAKFIGELTLGGGSLLKATTFGQMLKPHYQLDSHLPAMGLGFFLENRKQWHDQLIATHSGLWLGFHSSMMLAPAHQIGTFAFVNDASQTAHFATQNSLNRLLPSTLPKVKIEKGESCKHQWQSLIGTYKIPKAINSNVRLFLSHGQTFTVYQDDDRLKLKTRRGPWSRGITLQPVNGGNKLVFNANGRYMVFQRNSTGEVDQLLFRFHKLHKQ